MNCSSSSCILRLLVRSILALSAVLTVTSCSPKSFVASQQLGSSSQLPSSLTNDSISLSNILKERERLSSSQLNSALRQLLDHKNPSGDERSEASYILARLLQNSTNQQDLKEALDYFEKSKELPALHELSQWHLSEVAGSLGQEKLVRKTLETLLSEAKSEDKRAAAQYGLAQSFLRAHENDKAESSFKQVKAQFPHTEYAVGSEYYLGELRLSQLESPDANSKNSLEKERLLKEGISFFNSYLESSPTGHFAYAIIDRLRPLIKANPSAFDANDFDLYGQASYEQGHCRQALDFWQQGKHVRLMESASCYARMGAIERARATLLTAIKRYPGDYRYASVAGEISNHLSSAETLKLWRQVLALKPHNADAALWNIAKRSPAPASLNGYRELLSRYPHSTYAPEAQWWVFWDMVQHRKGKDLLPLAHVAEASYQKYSSARAAPRFLFWGGKVCEKAGSAKQAEYFYRKAHGSFPSDYYGYRSAARLAALHNAATPYGWGRRSIDPRLVNWDWPDPQAAGNRLDTVSSDPFWELVRLKEYEESLGILSNETPDLKAWVYALMNRPRHTITAASAHLPQGQPNASPVWQYAYPLLYTREIQQKSRAKKNVDAYLIHALVREESYYNRFAVSSSKAMGLTQVMPGTAYGVAKRLHISVPNPSVFFDAALNLELGIDYFSLCLSRFHDNPVLAVASYNGGAGAVRSWLNRQGHDDIDAFVENIPYRETRDYVRKVFRSYWTYFSIYQKL